MVKVQFDLTDVAKAKLERYMVYNGLDSKAVALNQIIEGLNLKLDQDEWLKKGEWLDDERVV